VILTALRTDYTRSIRFNSQMQPHVCQLLRIDGLFVDYYTYLLDKVIAPRLLQQFDKKISAGREAAMRYRDRLEPGGSKAGTELVRGSWTTAESGCVQGVDGRSSRAGK